MIQIIPSATAHSSSQEGILAKTYISQYEDYYIGGEDVGWSIDEKFHTNGTTLTFSFDTTDPHLNNTYKSYVIDGASKWSGTINIINKTDGSGVGLIKTFYNANSGIIAQFCNCSAYSSTGHLICWEIQLNRSYSMSSSTLAHELGHAIGLNDLYAVTNSGKLMYGYSNGTATSPTTSDIWGAKVITGVHSSHTWGYKYYSTASQTSNMHIKYCTDCKGLTTIVSACSYNAKNICIYCGIPYGYQPW